MTPRITNHSGTNSVVSLDIQRRSSWLAFPLIAMLLAATLGGCGGLPSSWQTPEVTLIGIQPREFSLARQVFAVTLAVDNPNDRALPIEAIRYRLSLEGQEIAEGGGRLERRIPAHGRDAVEVEVSGNLLDLASRLPMLTQQRHPLEWTVSGTLTLSGGLVVLPYRHAGRLDAEQWLRDARNGFPLPPAAIRPLTTDH